MANEKFKVKFGLAVGDTVATIDGSSGDISTNGDLILGGKNIFSGATDDIIQIENNTTITNGFYPALILKTTTTGVPAVGLGPALMFTGHTGASNFENAAYIAVESTDITPGSEDFNMQFGLMTGGATWATKLTLDSLGNLTTTGDLTVTGNEIKSSTGATAITLSGANVAVAGDLFVENDGNVYVSGTNLVLNNNDTAGATVDITSYRGVAGATSARIRWNETTDRWQTTVDNSVYLNIPNQNLDTTDSPSFATVDTTNLEVTNIKAKDGTAAMTIADSTGVVTVSTELQVDNINISTNTIASTDLNGNIVLDTNGTGIVDVPGAFVADSISSAAQFLEDLAGNQIAAATARTFTTNSTTITTIASTTRKAMKIMIVADDATDTQVIEALVMRDAGEASGAQVTFYGELRTDAALATFTADYDAGTSVIRLRATPASATSTTFKVVRTSLF